MKHYKKFKEYIEKNELFPQNKEHIVLVSGGKDSNALILLIEEYRKEKELHITYLQVAFPENNQLPLKTNEQITPIQTNKDLDNTTKPCELCKEIRRDEIKKYLNNKKNLIIHTGHTTDDSIAYFLEIMLVEVKELLGLQRPETITPITIQEESFEHFSRIFPKICFSNNITLAKPLINFNRREINDVLEEANVNNKTNCCPYTCKRPKRNIFQLIDTLPRKEAEKLYHTYSLKKIRATMKEKIKNYDEAIQAIKKQEYKKYLL